MANTHTTEAPHWQLHAEATRYANSTMRHMRSRAYQPGSYPEIEEALHSPSGANAAWQVAYNKGYAVAKAKARKQQAQRQANVRRQDPVSLLANY